MDKPIYYFKENDMNSKFYENQNNNQFVQKEQITQFEQDKQYSQQIAKERSNQPLQTQNNIDLLNNTVNNQMRIKENNNQPKMDDFVEHYYQTTNLINKQTAIDYECSSNEQCLSKLSINKPAKICKVLGNLKLKRRLLDLGFTNNATVKILTISPLKNSYLLSLHGYTIALRRNAVESIFVKVE